MTTFWSRERLVNTSTTGGQEQPSVAALVNGGYVVAWVDLGPATDEVRMQRYDASGEPVGGEVLVGTVASTFGQGRPQVVGLPNGGFAIGWQSDAQSLTLQRYLSTGAPNGAAIGVNFTNNGQLSVPFEMAANAASGVNITYTRVFEGETDVAGRIVSNAGAIGSEFVVDATVAVAESSSYVAVNGGAMAVTWHDPSSNAGDVFIRYFNPATGSQLGAETRLNTTTAGAQSLAPVTPLADGFLAVWRDGTTIRGQMIDANRAFRGGEFTISTEAGTGADDIAMVETANGNFFVVFRGTDGSLYGQAMTSEATLDGGRIRIADSLAANLSVDLALLADGRIAVTWSTLADTTGVDNAGAAVMTRIIDPRQGGGVVQGTLAAETLRGHPTLPDWIVGFAGADTILGLGGDDSIEGGLSGDSLSGGDGDDRLYGGAGADSLFGDNGDDRLEGDGASDLLLGGAGDDLLLGGASSDSLNGGAGFDTALYASSRTSYTLARQFNGAVQVTGIGAAVADGVDTMIEVERISFANVTIGAAPVFDFIGDFNADVVLRHVPTGEMSFWNLAGGAFQSSTAFASISSNVQIVDAGDFDGNGFSDLLYRDVATGAVSIQPFSLGAVGAVAQVGGVGGSIQVVGAGDFNADNRSEILLRDQSSGAVTFWSLNSNHVFEASVALGGVLPSMEIVGTGDFFGNGGSDVLIRDLSSGSVIVWRIEDNAFVSSTTVGGVPGSFKVIGAFDFTGDGIADILHLDQSTGGISYWRTNADGGFVSSTQIGGITANTSIIDARDVNGDGFADVLLRDSLDGSVDAFTVVDGVFSAFVQLGGAGTEFVFA